MRRYALDVIRADGTYWRTVHLQAWSPEDALVRGARWLRLERLAPSGYTMRNARQDSPALAR